jgi:hypothetical protein
VKAQERAASRASNMSSSILEHVDLFKFAAVSYLCYWIKVDHIYFRWNNLTNQTLNDFLIRYKVRRTIPGKDLSAFTSIIKQRRGETITESVVPKLIADACREMETQYNRKCLSAVSKVLWMAHGHPFAIYDALARKGLEQKTGSKLKDNDDRYCCYYHYWLQEFRSHETQIRTAQEWLPKSILVRRLVGFGAASEDELRSRVSQSWFANRIFDQWLMNIGSGWPTTRGALEAAQMLDPTEAGL